MREILPRNADQRLREKLIAVIESSGVEFDRGLKDDTSLIKSGKLDSLGLFNVVLFIESEVGPELDLTSFDLSHEWETIAEILRFIVRHRTGRKRSRERALPH
jgi:acyl carrier protein